MDDIDRRATAMCRTPLGCAFLAEAARLGMEPDDIAAPAVTFGLLALALDEVTVWRVDHDEVVTGLLREGPHLYLLAEEVLRQPDAGWWFGPLDRAAQLTFEDPVEGLWEGHLQSPPSRPSTHWERYAQKPDWRKETSTGRAGMSSLLLGQANTVGDLGPLALPDECYRLTVSPSARIYRVDGPEAWHRLCMRYPADYEDGQIVPDYGVVARDWDGVHITLGGLLTADQIRVEGERGWTCLWAWEAEVCVWLRWVFDEVNPVAVDAETIMAWPDYLLRGRPRRLPAGLRTD